MKYVGMRIKQRRIELGLTQMELAQRMHYTSKAAICKIEKGDYNLTTERVKKLATALECEPAFLMGWTDETDKTPHDIFVEDAIALYTKYLSSDLKTRKMIDMLLEKE